MANNVDLVSGWNGVWSSIQSTVGTQLTGLLTAVGVLIVVFALGKWFWERRRGGGGAGHSALMYSMAVGALLASPDLVLPVLLTIIDYLCNAVVGVFHK